MTKIAEITDNHFYFSSTAQVTDIVISLKFSKIKVCIFHFHSFFFKVTLCHNGHFGIFYFLDSAAIEFGAISFNWHILSSINRFVWVYKTKLVIKYVDKTINQNVIKLENKTLVPMFLTIEVKLRSTVIKSTIGIQE